MEGLDALGGTDVRIGKNWNITENFVHSVGWIDSSQFVKGLRPIILVFKETESLSVVTTGETKNFYPTVEYLGV